MTRRHVAAGAPEPPTAVTSAGDAVMITLPLSGLTDAVVVLDRHWHYVVVNEKAAALFGRTPDALIGRHIWTEFPDGVGQPFQHAYERVMATGREERFEAYYAPWGRWFENRVFPTADGILILFTETTEVHRQRLELEHSERRFRALIEATQFMAWWTDAHGAIVEPLPQWLAFTGQTPEEAAGWGWLAAVHPDDRERITSTWAEPPAPHDIEYRLRRHDGAWRTMVARAVPFRDADGALREWVGTLTDVTDDRAARSALVTSEARFRSLSASSPVGIFTTDPMGSVTYVNRRGLEIWAASEEELLGFGWTARVHPDDLPRVLQRWRAARAAGVEHAQEEYRLRLPDGTVRYVAGRSASLRDAAGVETGAVGTIEDVTAQRELEERLRQTQRLEAVGRFAGGIAHDFNNLLTVIHGNLEFAMRDLPADLATQSDLAEIAAATQRARTLVRQLLAFSRQQVLTPRRVDVNELVQGAARLLRPVLGEEIALDVALSPEPLVVDADPAQLEQVLFNLTINARDAMLTPRHGHAGRGGALTIETDAVTLTPDEATTWEPLGAGRYVRLVVRDSGHGMDPETASHAFEPFFTTKPVGEGTGLGLASVYGIVTQCGGAVRVASAPGEGTTVAVLLPRADEQVPRRSDDSAAASDRDAGRPRGTVLLVEDERPVRVAARRMLEREGFTVLEARHGAEALLAWRGRRGDVVAVVTDVRIPEMGGRELVAALRADAPDLPVVYVSGYPDEGLMATIGPTAAFVQKPFTAEALHDALARLLAPESPG